MNETFPIEKRDICKLSCPVLVYLINNDVPHCSIQNIASKDKKQEQKTHITHS